MCFFESIFPLFFPAGHAGFDEQYPGLFQNIGSDDSMNGQSGSGRQAAQEFFQRVGESRGL